MAWRPAISIRNSLWQAGAVDPEAWEAGREVGWAREAEEEPVAGWEPAVREAMGGKQMMDPLQRQARMEQMQALSTPTKFRIKKIKLADKE